ncbi:MAG: amidase [Chloroflexi bacterium]|mgnify:CR=1 FL=1|jgi:amidase|nr:amidase [Chloroflexota bacterium]MBT4073213.1 amidase [Chloroflexota bacterium]MBT4515611.1 amidase [Chloroflexota bacterium]MBT6681162.1 amidase [Chloroflexota bacterium]
MTEDLHYKTISELAPQVRDGKLSSVELTESQLDRIGQLDGHLKSYATLMADSARQQAKAADAEIASGNYRGPLHGIPIAVKDLCYTEGVRTMGGSAVFADNVPDFDATVVTRLNDAGAVMLGKLNLTEGAMGGYNPKLDIPENPWADRHWAGQSSSGSGVATAAGLAYGTLGSDTGGSIRYPAAACGTVGVKPTWGRVSRYGVMNLAQSLDHVGPLTRSAADSGIMLQAIAGYDPNDPTSLPNSVPAMTGTLDVGVRGLKIGYDERYASEDLEPEIANSIAESVKVMEGLGAEIVTVKMPSRLREYLEAWPVICSSEAASAHAETFPERADEYGPWFRGWLTSGASHTAAEFAEAKVLRAACVGELRNTMRGIDLLACPSAHTTAYPITHEELYGPIPPSRVPWQSRFTAPMDYSGLPTISLPCGLNDRNVPLSLQFVGHHLSEQLLIQAGHAFEQATDFHSLHPLP